MSAVGYRFPNEVILPHGPTVPFAVAVLALGRPSLQLQDYWRKYHNFPRSHGTGLGRYFLTAELVDWIRSRDRVCRRIGEPAHAMDARREAK